MIKGIAVAGSILVDKIFEIHRYPNPGELAPIHGLSRAVGGCVPNVAIDLKRMDPSLPVYALGRIGDDEDGRFARKEMEEEGVNVSHLSVSGSQTSFTEVMSVTGGQRTFFSYPGSSADFGFSDIPFDSLDIKRLHLGYFLLLPTVDQGDGLKILKEAKRRGIQTSIDLVSENGDRYSSILPCLPYVDDLIVNEVEAARLAGEEPSFANMESIGKKLLSLGVTTRVIIHAPEFGMVITPKKTTVLPSLRISPDEIAGTTGAGDAFCAAALLSLLEGKGDEELLAFASMAAGSALLSLDATSAIRTEKEIRSSWEGRERRILC